MPSDLRSRLPIFSKCSAIGHTFCHDDELTRHNTGPHGTASCKNGENCFWNARLDQYLSFKKNFAEKSILVGENDRVLYSDLQRELEISEIFSVAVILCKNIVQITGFRRLQKNWDSQIFFRIFPNG